MTLSGEGTTKYLIVEVARITCRHRIIAMIISELRLK